MMAITTSSSISVNADLRNRVSMFPPPNESKADDESGLVSPSARGEQAKLTCQGSATSRAPAGHGRRPETIENGAVGHNLANEDVMRGLREVQPFSDIS